MVVEKVNEDKEAFWRRRIKKNIKVWRRHLNLLAEVIKRNHRVRDTNSIAMNRKYNIDSVGYIYVIMQLKVEIHNGSLALRNYTSKVEQFQQNKLFLSNPSH